MAIGDNEVRFDLREKANVFDYEQVRGDTETFINVN